MSKLTFSDNTSTWLNVIRGVAAQIVVISHTFQLFYSGEPAVVRWSVSKLYWVIISIEPFVQDAVVAFFVISGWLVGGKILREMIGQEFDWRQYTIDRTTRLWIVLIPALVVTMALDLVAIHFGGATSIIASRSQFYPTWWDHVDPWSFWTFLSNAVFLQNIASWQFGTNLSLWSLSNEFWYYFLFPPLLGIYLATTWKRKLIFLLIAMGIISLFLASKSLFPSNPFNYIFYFVIWSIAAVGAWLQKKAAIVGIAILSVCTVAILATTGGPRMLPSFESDLRTSVLVLGFLIASQDIPAKWLSLPARFFSGYSYSLYVIHLPVVVFLMSFDPALNSRLPYSSDALARFVGYVVIVNCVAWGFSLLTERNTARIRSAIWLPGASGARHVI